MKIKVSDYIAKWLVEYGVKHVFMISGGGAMHINDSIGKQEGLAYFCNQHEQASAIGAEGYARYSGKLAVVSVTSGPGGTNTLTGVIGQWLDSVPVLYISGQVKQETTIASCKELELRQLGDQEINIVDIIKPVVKFAAMVEDALLIRAYLETATKIAVSGRPGPVWLDIPLNIQGAVIEETDLTDVLPMNPLRELTPNHDEKLWITRVMELLRGAKRPVIVAGHGIRIAGAQDRFLLLAEKLQIPVVTSFNGMDLIASEEKLYIGRLGREGDRAGNFAVQNSDLILFVGTRNNIRQIGYNWDSFARMADKIVVDIDSRELKKPTLVPNLPIPMDAGEFIDKLLEQLGERPLASQWNDWLDWCIVRKRKYPVVLPEYQSSPNKVHPYYFMKILTDLLPEGSCVVTGNGSASVIFGQAAVIKKHQRVIRNSGCAAMGYDLPAAIGASVAQGKTMDIICLAGDGSLQMNLQELGTITYHQLPIKLFILNNGGYFSIQQTQKNFFEGRRVASGPDSGVCIPDFCSLAQAYRLPSMRLESHEGLALKLQSFFRQRGPAVCEVMVTDEVEFSPKVSSRKMEDGRMVSRPLEDMWPFLPREEYLSNLLIPEWEEA